MPMKLLTHIFLSFVVLICAWGCADLPYLYDGDTNSDITTTSVRTPLEAVDIAHRADNIIRGTDSRYISRTTQLSNVTILGTNSSRYGTNDTVLYIVEYDDNQGFAIIAANREVEPILAVIDEGNYQDVASSGNEGFNQFVEMAYSYAKSPGISAGNPTIKPWATADEYREKRTVIHEVRVEPKTKNLKWGQHFPEGNACPNGVCGCGVTAMFLSLSCIERPTSIVLTFQSDYNDATPIQWSKIKEHKLSSFHNLWPSGDNCDAYSHAHIANICRELGKRSDAEYEDLENVNINRTGTTEKKYS